MGFFFFLYLVDLCLDDEELDKRRGAFDGRVDVLQGDGVLLDMIKMLGEEILHPQQGGGRLRLSVIYTSRKHIPTVTNDTVCIWSELLLTSWGRVPAVLFVRLSIFKPQFHNFETKTKKI